MGDQGMREIITISSQPIVCPIFLFSIPFSLPLPLLFLSQTFPQSRTHTLSLSPSLLPLLLSLQSNISLSLSLIPLSLPLSHPSLFVSLPHTFTRIHCISNDGVGEFIEFRIKLDL